MAKAKKKLVLTEAPDEAEDQSAPIVSAKTEQAKKANASEEQVDRVAEIDEAIRTGIPLRPFYQTVKLSGEGRYRVIGKAPVGNWMSPVLNESEAQNTAIKMNRVDPEQKEERRRNGGKLGVGGVVASGWTEEQTSRVVNPIVVDRKRE